jgi:hypothetical protein
MLEILLSETLCHVMQRLPCPRGDSCPYAHNLFEYCKYALATGPFYTFALSFLGRARACTLNAWHGLLA